MISSLVPSQISADITSTTQQVEKVTEDGLYDVCSVEAKKAQLLKYKNVLENMANRVEQLRSQQLTGAKPVYSHPPPIPAAFNTGR